MLPETNSNSVIAAILVNKGEDLAKFLMTEKSRDAFC